MYISGTIGTFQSRLHQLPSGIADLSGLSNNFLLEGQSYLTLSTGFASTGLIHVWNREFKKKWYEITKTGINGLYF